MHKNICKNNCEFATKVVFLSRAGLDEDWLYRCSKIDQIITTDSSILKLGCATYIQKSPQPRSERPETEKTGNLIEESKELLKKINQQIEENKLKNPYVAPVKPLEEQTPEPKVVTPAAPAQVKLVVEPQKPVPVIPVIVPAPHIQPAQEVPIQKQAVPEPVKPPVKPVAGELAKSATGETVPKKRGRKPKQAPAAVTQPTEQKLSVQPAVMVQPAPAQSPQATLPQLSDIAEKMDIRPSIYFPQGSTPQPELIPDIPIQKPAVSEPAKPVTGETVPKKRGRKPKQAGTTAPPAVPSAAGIETAKEPAEKSESSNIPPKP